MITRIPKQKPWLGFLLLISTLHIGAAESFVASSLLTRLDSPIILQGNSIQSYRDPAVLYHEGVFHLFCTQVQTDPDKKIYSYTIQSTSRDLNCPC